MTSWMTAYRRAGFLRVAAVQFVALTACAMAAYAGGTWFDPSAPRYQLTGNFLSDLGMTHAFSGRTNYVSCVLFSLALAPLGAAVIAFAWTWRDFAFSAGRARFVGHASVAFGTLSGTAFIGIGVTPFDLAFRLHNGMVIAGFGLLVGYVAMLTLVMAFNAVGRAAFAANLAYLALVVGYVALVLLGPRLDTEHGHTVQVIGQKVVAYGSMLHVLYLTTTTRAWLARIGRN